MCQREIVVPLHESLRSRPKAYLEHFGFQSPRWVHLGTIALLAVPVVGILLGIALHGSYRGVEVKAPDVVLAAVSLGALLIGYWQWGKARHETSMDNYYARLNIANCRQDGEQTRVRDMMKPSHPELAEEPPEIMMYVYAELDNLEYVVEKYRLGYMNAEQACRGLRTFQLRCWSPRFRRITHHRVHSGDYNPETADVVERVCEEIERLIAREFTDGGSGGGSQTARSEAVSSPASQSGRSSARPGEAATGTQGPRRRASDGSHLSAVPSPPSGRVGEAPRRRASDAPANQASAPSAPPSPPEPAGPERPPNAVGENR
jgi:hypothetical protein